ncbi:ATP-binding protein [uncultured Tyzzerella sp.]|uniref:ATP-binding protein n=1 Tax=uncultured Tyzzerella sp. TaxID=2321398 RepID=UPI0029436B2A|nr:ATP-binding protein [uncultured Tyzzerella sp.]
MRKFIFKIYLVLAFTMILLSTVFLIVFNSYNLIETEKKNISLILNIYDSLHNDIKESEINNILRQFDFKVDCIEKTDKKQIEKYIKKSEVKKNNENLYEDFFYKDGKLYYIKEYNEHIIFIYKNFNIVKILIIDWLIYVLIILITLVIIYNFLKRYLEKSIILPLQEISTQIPKLKNKNGKIFFKDYKLEEINNICKEIINIEKDLKSIDNMLKIERNKIEYILDNMAEGFVLFDKDKNVFAINKMAKKILGYDKNSLGENILYYTQNIKLVKNIDNTLNTNQKNIFDMKTDDNKTYSVHINKIQKGMFAKDTSGIIMLMIDVTAERENEKLKQEFFSNVSHELKTPITSIQGYAELLYNDFATSKEQEKEFLKIIQKESVNITNLINNILTISKLENKEIEINKSDINIKIVVDEIINSTKPMCIEQNIKIINKCEDITMLADYKKIHQLFNNLIVNAIKYNKDNGYVEINCFEDDKNINIIIKDSGVGISLVDRNRIFERFYRVEKGRSKALGGTGLGLSIVKHIVKYYNGKIKVKSTEGFGSEFIIKIPNKK